MNEKRKWFKSIRMGFMLVLEPFNLLLNPVNGKVILASKTRFDICDGKNTDDQQGDTHVKRWALFKVKFVGPIFHSKFSMGPVGK
ncbi:MAG: hypothetical protein GY820_20930 [Gammaproteobacteria bacterium]|nr:hypothetical protein [Gammaproteobacteria bacterium]